VVNSRPYSVLTGLDSADYALLWIGTGSRHGARFPAARIRQRMSGAGRRFLITNPLESPNLTLDERFALLASVDFVAEGNSCPLARFGLLIAQKPKTNAE
jgi:hypothetical protein